MPQPIFCGKIVWWRERRRDGSCQVDGSCVGCGAFFFAFQEMRCWRKWWTGFRAGCEMGGWEVVVSPVDLMFLMQ